MNFWKYTRGGSWNRLLGNLSEEEEGREKMFSMISSSSRILFTVEDSLSMNLKSL